MQMQTRIRSLLVFFAALFVSTAYVFTALGPSPPPAIWVSCPR